MNGYLVVMRHDMDDIPLLLTADEGEAMRFAAEVKEGDDAAAQKVLGLDASTPNAVSVYTFTDGKLSAMKYAKDMD